MHSPHAAAGHLGLEFTASTDGRPPSGSGTLRTGPDRGRAGLRRKPARPLITAGPSGRSGAVRPVRDRSGRVAEAAEPRLLLRGKSGLRLREKLVLPARDSKIRGQGPDLPLPGCNPGHIGYYAGYQE